MNFYRWAMRNGAAILFAISLFVFFAAFFGQVTLGLATVEHTSFPGDTTSSHGGLWIMLGALASALQSSGMMFAAACVVHILGRRYSADKDGRQ